MISSIEIEGTLKHKDNTEEPVTIKGSSVLSVVSVISVCEFCNNHDKDSISLEFNFRDKKIYYYCNNCKKMNSLELLTAKNQPLPRTRL